MVQNQYTYEWTEEDQKRHDEMVRNFSVSMISPVCLCGRRYFPNEAKTYYEYLVSEVKKELSSLDKYNRFMQLAKAWEKCYINASNDHDFSISNVLRFA